MHCENKARLHIEMLIEFHICWRALSWKTAKKNWRSNLNCKQFKFVYTKKWKDAFYFCEPFSGSINHSENTDCASFHCSVLMFVQVKLRKKIKTLICSLIQTSFEGSGIEKSVFYMKRATLCVIYNETGRVVPFAQPLQWWPMKKWMHLFVWVLRCFRKFIFFHLVQYLLRLFFPTIDLDRSLFKRQICSFGLGERLLCSLCHRHRCRIMLTRGYQDWGRTPRAQCISIDLNDLLLCV